jgi:glycine hydroxymethyltransferase
MAAIPTSLPGQKSLEEHDAELFDLIEREKHRQWSGLELIASENFTSKAVFQCLGSALTNKYSEGYPGKRYYGGNEYIDVIENLCIERALAAYGLNPEEWGVNVQPYSGSPANFAVYTALLRPHDRIMGLDLPSGGHLTHGFYTYSKADNGRKAVSATSIYFESLPYRVHPQTGYIDYDQLEAQAALFKPALIIAGGSAYPREWDYARYRKIADDNGSLLMMDMAHISGLVATGEAASPFQYADVVTTTTHKSLRGPRAGLIFYRKDARNFEARINAAVFPGLQGGPHVHQIAGVATQLKEVASPEFKEYARQIRLNAQALADQLTRVYGYTLATGGTENHLVLWDLKPQNLTGSKMQTVCDHASITLNKNAVLGDKSALTPGGVRIGAPALTTRGLKEEHFRQVADFLHEAVQIALNLQATSGKLLKDFENAAKNSPEVKALKAKVQKFITQFPMPGFDVETMRYKQTEA